MATLSSTIYQYFRVIDDWPSLSACRLPPLDGEAVVSGRDQNLVEGDVRWLFGHEEDELADVVGLKNAGFVLVADRHRPSVEDGCRHLIAAFCSRWGRYRFAGPWLIGLSR